MFLRIKSFIGIAIALVLLIVFFLEVGAINETPEDYVNVYHISEKSDNWQYKSIENFQIWNVLGGLVCIGYIIISIINLLKRIKVLRYGILIFEIVVIAWSVYNFYFWAGTGFDH